MPAYRPHATRNPYGQAPSVARKRICRSGVSAAKAVVAVCVSTIDPPKNTQVGRRAIDVPHEAVFSTSANSSGDRPISKDTTGNSSTHCELQFFYMSPIVVSFILFKYARNLGISPVLPRIEILSRMIHSKCLNRVGGTRWTNRLFVFPS